MPLATMSTAMRHFEARLKKSLQQAIYYLYVVAVVACNISISLHIEFFFLAKSVSTLCKEIEGEKKIFMLLKLVSPLIIEFPIEVIFSYQC